LLDLSWREHLGQRPPFARRLQFLARIDGDLALGQEEPVPGADSRDPAPDARWGEAEVLEVIHELAQVRRAEVGRPTNPGHRRPLRQPREVTPIRLAG